MAERAARCDQAVTGVFACCGATRSWCWSPVHNGSVFVSVSIVRRWMGSRFDVRLEMVDDLLLEVVDALGY